MLEKSILKTLIANEEMVVTISNMGYIKRTPLTEYKSQTRGGTGNKGVKHRDDDFVEHLFVTMTHNYICYLRIKVDVFG